LCHGQPLRTVEARNKALEDGYEVVRMFDCISKASYAEVVASTARAEAAPHARGGCPPPGGARSAESPRIARAPRRRGRTQAARAAAAAREPTRSRGRST
jgi:hypothetical protein